MRPADGDRLPLAAGKGGDRRVEPSHMEVEARHRLFRGFRHPRPVEDRQEAEQLALRLAAEKDVFADREIVGERKVLIDRLDAAFAGLLRRGEVDRLAVEQDLALVVVEHAGDRLDNGRFAGAVVAGERDNLAGIDVE